MKKPYLIIGSITVIVIILIVMTINYGLNIKYEQEKEDILNSRYLYFDNYDRNKSMVMEYLSVYEIIDENSYQRVKNNIYDNFSRELQQMYFSSAEYKGLDLHSIKTEIKTIKGTNNGYDMKNTFFIEYVLSGVNYNETIVNLIDIENGVITKIERLN